MNIAIIIAGGIGARMNQNIPKQFMIIEDKPVLIYTLEKFQNCNSINAIIVSCLEGWQEKVWDLAKEYNINKLKHVVKGGATGFESIRNGFNVAYENYGEESVIIIHDSIRPMISSEIIENGINICKQKGNATTYLPCQEAMFIVNENKESTETIDRSILARSQTPQMFLASEIKKVYEIADKNDIKDSITLQALFTLCGVKTYMYPGSEKNLKITTPDDIDIFKALLAVERIKNESL